jgi:hypothetical protein
MFFFFFKYFLVYKELYCKIVGEEDSIEDRDLFIQNVRLKNDTQYIFYLRSINYSENNLNGKIKELKK